MRRSSIVRRYVERNGIRVEAGYGVDRHRRDLRLAETGAGLNIRGEEVYGRLTSGIRLHSNGAPLILTRYPNCARL